MRWILAVLLIFYTQLGNTEDTGVIIGFMGAGGSFDHNAFLKYAYSRGLKPVVLKHDSVEIAAKIVNSNQVWEVYGYSLGARSIHKLLKQVRSPPSRIITIGAYRSTNVDFTDSGLPFYNFFDQSGRGQRSPGVHLNGVTHWSIQGAAVERLISVDKAQKK